MIPVHAVVERTLREPPCAVTHWTGRAMAKAMNLSLRTVQRIWQAHKLQPHRIRTFKRSTDPEFAAKLDDVVGLYMNPPRHAVVVSIDEKSQIQALDRTQPGLPLKRGKCATMTHDYKHNGTTTLFAALSVLEGKVIGRCVSRHRHQEFIRFIATVERSVPAGKVIRAILDNYAAHKHPNVSLGDDRRGSWHTTHGADRLPPVVNQHGKGALAQLGAGPRPFSRRLHQPSAQEVDLSAAVHVGACNHRRPCSPSSPISAHAL